MIKKIENPSETVFTITETVVKDYVEHVVKINGTVQYRQVKPFYMIPKENAKTFLDRFLDNFNMSNSGTLKRLDNTHDIIGDSGDLFYFISERRLQTLNFKQKFFYFLLKKIFFHGKATSIEQIKGRLMNY